MHVGTDKNKVTMKDIAKRLNISQNTVSLALRNIPTIKKETREDILRTAEEMGYVYVNGAAAALNGTAQIKHNICIFTDSSYFSTFYFYTDLKELLEIRLKDRGYGLIVESMFNPLITLEQLRTFCDINNIEGIIILGDMEYNQIRLVMELDIPVVTSGFYFAERFTDCVMEENISAAYGAVQTLYQRGYRKIGFLGNIALGVGQKERWMGYLSGLQHLGLEQGKAWSILYCASDTESLYQELTGFFRGGGSEAEVFLCACDQIALCAMEAAQDLNLRIPEDIGFVGFDNVHPTLTSEPRLTTMDPNNAEQAELLVRVLMERIQGDTSPKRRQIVAVSWVEGGSIRAAES